MQHLSEINGAVFFVDILGMSALTHQQIKIENDDFGCWLDRYGMKHTHQYLAASILAEFRQMLDELRTTYLNVKIAQLSDCAFIWSENVTQVIVFAANFMTKATKRGLLCRGGLSYGEIIESSHNLNFGRFIVGKAVTTAAKLETIAKGARILIDQDFPSKVWEYDQNFAARIAPLFAPFTNPIDFAIYDEFKWYLHPFLSPEVEDLSVLPTHRRIELTKERLKVAACVRLSPKFGWNSRSTQGLVQLRATTTFISESRLLNVHHNFAWTDVGTRSEHSLENAITTIEKYPDYKILAIAEEDQWIE